MDRSARVTSTGVLGGADLTVADGDVPVAGIPRAVLGRLVERRALVDAFVAARGLTRAEAEAAADAVLPAQRRDRPIFA